MFSKAKDSNHSIDSTAFVGSSSYRSCHTKEYNNYIISDHFKAMDIANDSSVLGNFNNHQFRADGINSKFFKKGNKYYINTEGEDGLNHDYVLNMLLVIFHYNNIS